MKIIKLPAANQRATPTPPYFPKGTVLLWIASLLVGTIAGLLWPWNARSKEMAPAPDARAVTTPSRETMQHWRVQTDFLSGQRRLPPNQAAAFVQHLGWQAYATRFNQRWQALHRARWEAVSRWAATELPTEQQTTVFYPFGGPDALYASLLFPQASEYLLVGLEPIGELPAPEILAGKELTPYLSDLETSLRSLLDLGFFITNQMQGDLQGRRLRGVLPVLLTLLARTEHEITNVEILHADAEGNWHTREYPVTAPAHAAIMLRNAIGVKIHCQPLAGGAPQTLTYVRLNLANPSLAQQRGLRTWLASRSSMTTLVKSASYLLHAPEFATLQDLLLRHSTTIVQDDSGIPLKHFTAAQWKLHFYGTYSLPIAPFTWTVQRDLQQQYLLPSNARPLPFGIGYHWQVGTSNLLVARKIGTEQSLVSPTLTGTAPARYNLILSGFPQWETAAPLLQQIVKQRQQVLITPVATGYQLSVGPYDTLPQAEQMLTEINRSAPSINGHISRVEK